MMPIFRLCAMICALFLTLTPGLAADRITVFAAASLRGALDEVVQTHDADVAVSYAGSGLIARQVAQGAPADVILLANTAWMDWLADRNLLDADHRIDLLGNSLVLIGPQNAPDMADISVAALTERLAGGRLAIGQTLGVPAGIYGRQWLEATGLWPALSTQLAEVENVRMALALVSRGEAPLGLVYASDALADPGVRAVHQIDPRSHDPIIYPVAVLRDRATPLVTSFMARLQSPEATAIFARHGFSAPGG